MIYPNKFSKILFRLFIILLSVLIITYGWIQKSSSDSTSQDSCDMTADLMVDVDTWQITEASLTADIKWQKVEPTSRPIVHLGSPNTGILATDDSVLYWQIDGTLECDNSPIVAAFETSTGQEQWRYRPNDGITTEIFTVHDGFILLNVSSITKLDEAGLELWKQDARQTVPFREFKTMFEVGNSLYFPTQFGEIYEISNSTGELLHVIKSDNVIAFWGDYALVEIDNNQLELQQWNGTITPVYTLSFPNEIFNNVELNPIFPFARRYGDILFLFFDSTRVEAHDFLTGDLLWSIEEPIHSVPAFVGDFLAVFRLNDSIEIRELPTGDVIGQIQISHNVEGSTSTDSDRYSIWIAGNSDNLFVRHLDTLELIAIELSLPLSGT